MKTIKSFDSRYYGNPSAVFLRLPTANFLKSFVLNMPLDVGVAFKQLRKLREVLTQLTDPLGALAATPFLVRGGPVSPEDDHGGATRLAFPAVPLAIADPPPTA